MLLFKFRDFTKKLMMNYEATRLNSSFIINVIVAEKPIVESAIKI